MKSTDEPIEGSLPLLWAMHHKINENLPGFIVCRKKTIWRLTWAVAVQRTRNSKGSFRVYKNKTILQYHDYIFHPDTPVRPREVSSKAGRCSASYYDERCEVNSVLSRWWHWSPKGVSQSWGTAGGNLKATNALVELLPTAEVRLRESHTRPLCFPTESIVRKGFTVLK